MREKEQCKNKVAKVKRLLFIIQVVQKAFTVHPWPLEESTYMVLNEYLLDTCYASELLEDSVLINQKNILVMMEKRKIDNK